MEASKVVAAEKKTAAFMPPVRVCLPVWQILLLLFDQIH